MTEREKRVDEANRRNAERLARTYSSANAEALRQREAFVRRRAIERMRG